MATAPSNAKQQAPATAPPSREIAKPAARSVGFAPRDFGEAWRFATALAASELVPQALRRKPHDVFLVLLAGRDFGLSVTQAIRSLHVIEGSVVMSAALMKAICLTSEVCEYFQMVESSDVSATYEAKRRGDAHPVRITWKIEQAQRAGLLDRKGPGGRPNNWKAYPEAMLRARATSALAREVFPDLMLGVYTAEELEAEEMEPAGLDDFDVEMAEAAAGEATEAETQLKPDRPQLQLEAPPPPAASPVEAPKEEPKAARNPSRAQALWGRLQEARAAALPPDAIPDPGPGPALINKCVGEWIAEHSEATVEKLWAMFLRDDWARSRHPPYTWRAFTREKRAEYLSRMQDQLRAERMGQEKTEPRPPAVYAVPPPADRAVLDGLLTNLRPKVNAYARDLIARIEGAAIDGDCLVLWLPDALMRDWLGDHYRGAILEALALPHVTRLEYVTPGAQQAPATPPAITVVPVVAERLEQLSTPPADNAPIVASNEGFDRVAALVASPPPPNEALKKASAPPDLVGPWVKVLDDCPRLDLLEELGKQIDADADLGDGDRRKVRAHWLKRQAELKLAAQPAPPAGEGSSKTKASKVKAPPRKGPRQPGDDDDEEEPPARANSTNWLEVAKSLAGTLASEEEIKQAAPKIAGIKRQGGVTLHEAVDGVFSERLREIQAQANKRV